MTREQIITAVIAEHGAVAVHAAAQSALEGDYAPIRALGYDAQTLGDVWTAHGLAFDRMTPGEHALEKMHAEHAVNKLARQVQWSRANESKRIAAGGRRMPGGVLPADAAEALAKLQQSGYADSATACIARALVAAARYA